MFDYLGILISVILGLALAHLLLGGCRMIQMRHTVRPYWVQLVWTLSILLYVLAIWWGMFWWKHMQVWTVQEFFFLSGYSIVLFLLASMLFPLECAEGLDFEDYFFLNRKWFFGIMLVALLMDIPETVSKAYLHLRPVPPEYWLFMPTALALTLVALGTANRRVHAGLSVLWLLSLLSYMIFSSLDRIATA